MAIVYRGVKGSKLTVPEMDGNLAELNKPQRGYVWVYELDDLPTPSGSVITLEDDFTYFIMTSIDLEGNRLISGENTVILGSSSENSRITSTGLSAGTALLTATTPLAIRHITFEDIDTFCDINGGVSFASLALDWTGVNFQNVPNVGTFQNFGNLIFDKGAFLSASNLRLGGNFGTVSFANSLFVSSGGGGTMFDVLSNAVCSRRIRFIYSSLVVLGSDTGINVDGGATIPVENFILDTINFSGGGTYIGTIASDDIRSLWTKCVGISNSAEVAYYSMNGNATLTDIVSIGEPVKINGTTTQQAITQKFTCSNNRATYDGGLTRIFKVTAVMSVIAGNNHQIGAYIAKNGTVINESEIYATTAGNGRAESIKIQTIVQLQQGNYVEIFIENNTATTDVTVSDLSVIVESLN